MDDVYDTQLRALLDQVLADDKRSLNEYVVATRDMLKDHDVINVWTCAGNAMMENVTEGNINSKQLVILLVTAILQLAQQEEDNG